MQSWPQKLITKSNQLDMFPKFITQENPKVMFKCDSLLFPLNPLFSIQQRYICYSIFVFHFQWEPLSPLPSSAAVAVRPRSLRDLGGIWGILDNDDLLRYYYGLSSDVFQIVYYLLLEKILQKIFIFLFLM